MSERPPRALLTDMLASAERIVEIHARAATLRGPVHQSDALAAILFHFIIVGEAALRLGDEFHARHPAIPWRRIIDHRNYLAHGYDTVDSALLTETIGRHLPPLIAELHRLMDTPDLRPRHD